MIVSAKFTGEVTPSVLLLWFSARLCGMPLLCRAKPLYVYYQQGKNLNAIIANLSRASYISIAKDRPVHYNS